MTFLLSKLLPDAWGVEETSKSHASISKFNVLVYFSLDPLFRGRFQGGHNPSDLWNLGRGRYVEGGDRS